MMTQPQPMITLSDIAQWGERIAALEAEVKALRAEKAKGQRDVLTVNEAAKLLGVCPSIVYDYIRAGKLPTFKTSHDSRIYRIYRTDLDKLVAELRRAAQ